MPTLLAPELDTGSPRQAEPSTAALLAVLHGVFAGRSRKSGEPAINHSLEAALDALPTWQGDWMSPCGARASTSPPRSRSG